MKTRPLAIALIAAAPTPTPRADFFQLNDELRVMVPVTAIPVKDRVALTQSMLREFFLNDMATNELLANAVDIIWAELNAKAK